MATKVADLFAALGIRVNKGAFANANKQISGIKQAALGIGAVFAGKALGKALIGFNSNVEDSKNKIAGMLALTKKTDLSAELANANTLMTNLQKRAAKLPGTTTEYVNMLGMLTQPVTDAGLGMKDLEDLTVNAVVAAKGLGVEWEVAARDIDQAIRGQFKSTDQLTGKILGSVGFKGEEGRAKFNAMSAKDRAATLKAALGQKQIVQLAEAQGNTFSGVLSTLKDAAEQFLGKVGIPLFKALGDAIRGANVFLAEHADEVAAVAAVIGSVLVGAFDAVGAVMAFFAEHTDLTMAIVITLTALMTAFGIASAIAWIAATWPILAIVAAVGLVVYAVLKLRKHIGAVLSWIGKKWDALWDGIKSAAGAIRDYYVAIGTGIKDFFVSVVDWVSDKLDEIVDKAEEVADDVLNVFGIDLTTNKELRAGLARTQSIKDDPNSAYNQVMRRQAATPSVPVRGAGVSGAGGAGPITINQTVNAAPGMNEQQVADIASKGMAKELRNTLADRGQR